MGLGAMPCTAVSFFADQQLGHKCLLRDILTVLIAP